MDKQLTLIIPTYNMEKYLHTCLDSLIMDKGMDLLEVLVVNDGSKDASSAIAHEYERKYPDVFHVIDKENGNYGSCVNRGLKEATGRYVKILDADDHFDTASLKQLMERIKDINADLILTDNIIFGDNDISQKYYGFELPKMKVLNFADYCDRLKSNIQMHNVTYRRSIFSQFDYHQTEGISYTDMEWILAPMARVQTMIYFPIPLYNYLIGRVGQTISAEQIIRSSSHVVKLANSMLAMFLDAKDVTPAIYDYLYFRLTRQIKSLYRTFLAEVPGLNTDGLIAFDKCLKETLPQLYQDCARITMGPFIRIYYVDYWRKHQYAPQPTIFYTIFNGYTKTLFWCKKMLHIDHV